MARLSPVYPTDPRPGDHIGYVEWMIRGVLTRIELHQPKSVTPARCRCDTLEARQDGLALIVGGLNAVNRFAAQRLIPRPMSRRTIAGLRDDEPWAP